MQDFQSNTLNNKYKLNNKYRLVIIQVHELASSLCREVY